MTVLQQRAEWEKYQGMAHLPEDFTEYWQKRWDRAAPVAVEVEPACVQHAAAVYENLRVRTAGGKVAIRYLRPAKGGPFPTVLMFHDLDRGVRGWHHMTRFLALGYAVAALEAEVFTDDWKVSLKPLGLERRYDDALTMAQVVRAMPHTDKGRLVTWGEGFGGGLAVVTAALLPGGARCAALHPFPADLRGIYREREDENEANLDHLDLVNFASLLSKPLLLGTALLDEVAPPQGQYALFHRGACPKRHLVYPKYGHERNNFFENELLKFLWD